MKLTIKPVVHLYVLMITCIVIMYTIKLLKGDSWILIHDFQLESDRPRTADFQFSDRCYVQLSAASVSA